MLCLIVLPIRHRFEAIAFRSRSAMVGLLRASGMNQNLRRCFNWPRRLSSPDHPLLSYYQLECHLVILVARRALDFLVVQGYVISQCMSSPHLLSCHHARCRTFAVLRDQRQKKASLLRGLI